MAPRFVAPWTGKLEAGVLVKRYMRFLADIEFQDGRTETVHCANSGSMLGMKSPGMPALCSTSPTPGRKLKQTLEFIQPEAGGAWVGVNTMRPNEVLEAVLRRGDVPDLDGTHLRREVKYGKNSRVDIVLGDDEARLHYVEVKNTTLTEDRADGGRTASFPDAVTERGAKHMAELARMVKAGHHATVVFFVNRADCDAFDVARSIDPGYGKAFDKAEKAGVTMRPLCFEAGPKGWRFLRELPRV